MPDNQTFPTLPPDAPMPWLARNRKIVILGGLVVILAMVAGVTAWLGRQKPAVTGTTNQTTVNTANTLSPSQTRPTFQRSTVSNTSTTLPPVYRPPTTDDLQRAISNHNSNSSTVQKP